MQYCDVKSTCLVNKCRVALFCTFSFSTENIFYEIEYLYNTFYTFVNLKKKNYIFKDIFVEIFPFVFVD